MAKYIGIKNRSPLKWRVPRQPCPSPAGWDDLHVRCAAARSRDFVRGAMPTARLR